MSDKQGSEITATPVIVEMTVTNLGTRRADRLCVGDLVLLGTSVATVTEADFTDDAQNVLVTFQVQLGAFRPTWRSPVCVPRDAEYHVFAVKAVGAGLR
jgi:hypothetical protein